MATVETGRVTATLGFVSSGSKSLRRATACSEPTTSSIDGWARLIQRSLRTAPGFIVSVSALPSPTHFLRTAVIGSGASEAAWSSSTRRFSARIEPLHLRPRGWWVVRATSATPAYPQPSCRSTSGSVRWFSIRASTLRPSCVAPSVICTAMPSRTSGGGDVRLGGAPAAGGDEGEQQPEREEAHPGCIGRAGGPLYGSGSDGRRDHTVTSSRLPCLRWMERR